MKVQVDEFFLIHGFLGAPSDWEPTILNLKQAYPEARFVCPDLLSFFSSHQECSFSSWKQNILSVLRPDTVRVVVGYSLGGRLALHLPAESFDKLFLVASHPGLLHGHELRMQQDQAWASRLNKESASHWLQAWNGQAVFKNDFHRPSRQLDGQEEQWGRILCGLSLAQQKDKREFISMNQQKIYWCAGERDEKFQVLKAELLSYLPNSHIFDIPNSGHGVIFDQPQFLAQAIVERL
jgi:pimeloyl-ACP methyl ester carboxylesterase